jgi:protein-S-isoprenylcysteine O-methyltransferase Ste14
VLDQRFSGLVAIQPGHTLVTSGVYGVIRNPSYLGLLINSLGWSLRFVRELGLLTALLVPPLRYASKPERSCCTPSLALSTTPTYRARTSRLIPGIY